MLENFLGMLRKRRRIETEAQASAATSGNGSSAGDPCWDSFSAATASGADDVTMPERQYNHTAPTRIRTTETATSTVTATSTAAMAAATAVSQALLPLARGPLCPLDRPFNLNERFVSVLDQLDARVEKFRKDALGLQEKKDFLLMSIDLIRSHDMLQTMLESEREEIHCYIQRVNARLGTVELMVRTVRDSSQEDSLSQINELIDMMITMGDPVLARQRCQQYLNACCSAAEAGHGHVSYSPGHQDIDAGPVDKKFESTLLGCTLDDQKNIKKRLQALMGYLNKQTIRS